MTLYINSGSYATVVATIAKPGVIDIWRLKSATLCPFRHDNWINSITTDITAKDLMSIGYTIVPRYMGV